MTDHNLTAEATRNAIVEMLHRKQDMKAARWVQEMKIPTLTRVAAFTTVHYRPTVLQYFDRVMRNLSEFRVARMHLTVVTNVTDGPELGMLHSMCRIYFSPHDYVITSAPGCEPPHAMTWMHKPFIRTMADNTDFSHFIYLEDDIGLTWRNFEYWVEFADALRPLGLIPSFLRTECKDGRLIACDAQDITHNPKIIDVAGQPFAQQRCAYCACFVMDRQHVTEYFDSRSFDLERSKEVSQWGLPERAAQGLCWETPPPGFVHRYVLPVTAGLAPHPMCHVSHMSNKVTGAPHPVLGKIAVGRVFT